MMRYDVAVIGGGAAGLSGALVLSRARRRVLVADAGAPRNAPATHMYGYLSRDGMPPAELLASGRDEVKSYGGEIVAGTVTDLVPDGAGGFRVVLADRQRIAARRLLMTPPRDMFEGVTMATPTPSAQPAAAGPPNRHQLALMIWLAVFPTLTILNLVLGDWLSTVTSVVRTFVLATIAVPIVIYGLMPPLHRLRGRLLTHIAARSATTPS